MITLIEEHRGTLLQLSHRYRVQRLEGFGAAGASRQDRMTQIQVLSESPVKGYELQVGGQGERGQIGVTPTLGRKLRQLSSANQKLISGRYTPGPPHRLDIFLVEQLVNSFIRQVDAARFAAGYERQFSRLLFRLSILLTGRKRGDHNPCAFGKGRASVKYHHAVMNAPWNLHASMIAESPAQAKKPDPSREPRHEGG